MGKGNTLAGKKTPTRQCIGCGDKKDKKELIRVIKTPEGEITVDFTGKKNGRGAYICNSTECLKQAVKKILRTLIKDTDSKGHISGT